MIDNDILNHKVILLIGQYGSEKTTFLHEIYDFFMNLIAIEALNIIQNREIINLLNQINFDDYEVIYIPGSGVRDFRELLFNSLVPLIQRMNLELEENEFIINTEENFNRIMNQMEIINQVFSPSHFQFIRLDDNFYYLTFGGKLCNFVFCQVLGINELKIDQIGIVSRLPIDFSKLPLNLNDYETIIENLFSSSQIGTIFQSLLPESIQRK